MKFPQTIKNSTIWKYIEKSIKLKKNTTKQMEIKKRILCLSKEYTATLIRDTDYLLIIKII